MDLHISYITKLTAIELGEYPGAEVLGWSVSSGCELSDIIEIIVETIAREVILQLPLSECTFLLDMRDHLRRSTDWGDEPPYQCEMPSDFLRLHSLKMKDWPRPLSEEYRGDEARLALADSAPVWLAKRPSRPILEIIPPASGNYTILRFGPTSCSDVSIATYIPDVSYDSEEGMLRNFQPLAIPVLAKKIASHLKSI
ncbi:MAG: hypothetical protein K2M31_05125 [Muribaculaceae bacterium]|nr:hypothetical protein [Muribaculaceae bacterium]